MLIFPQCNLFLHIQSCLLTDKQDAWYKAQNGTDEMWSTESNSNANNYAANYVLNDQSCPTGIYTTSYSSIERCNSCLKGLRAMSLSGEDERKCHIYIAECLAVRANNP